jgi:hypothetical protein
MALYDERNPAAEVRLSDEGDIRRELFAEFRRKAGLAELDESPAALERLESALDLELDAIETKPDIEAALARLSKSGHLPSDVYDVFFIENLWDVYGSDWGEEQNRALLTVRKADREQHFGEGEVNGEPSLISLFARRFDHPKYPYRSYTMLTAGMREGLRLHVHQVWKLFDDEVRTSDAKDLVTLLRRFSDVYGLETRVNGVVSKFFLNTALSSEPTERQITVLPRAVSDNKGRKVERRGHTMLTNFELWNGVVRKAALTIAVDLDKYKSALESHHW